MNFSSNKSWTFPTICISRYFCLFLRIRGDLFP